jgi:hypothetical protein
VRKSKLIEKAKAAGYAVLTQSYGGGEKIRITGKGKDLTIWPNGKILRNDIAPEMAIYMTVTDASNYLILSRGST